MPVFRYVKRSTEGAPEHLDVTFAGEGRESLDASMREMGFEFFQVLEGGPRSSSAPFFPGADAPEPLTPRMPPPPGRGIMADVVPSDVPAGAPPEQSVLSGKRALGAALGDRARRAIDVFRRRAPSSEAASASEPVIAGEAPKRAGLLGRVAAPAALTLAILGALVVHAKAVQGGFVDDDFIRALDIQPKSDWQAATERFRGLFPGSFELGFLAAWQVFRTDAAWYLRVIVLSHALSVAIVYGVARALSGRTAVAAVAAGVWGITPGFQATLQSLGAYGAVITAATLGWALFEIARAAESYRPPTAFALVRVNLALLLCAGGMPGAWLGVLVFPLASYLLLPAESARLRSALLTLPASAASLAAGVAFVQQVAPSLGQPFSVFRIFVELLAYGTGITAAGPLTTIHANARGVGLFDGPSYTVAILVSAGVALVVAAFLIVRLVRGESEERREIAGLLLLALALYLGVACHRAEFLGKRGIDWIAARSPQHYAANLPIVLAVAAAWGRLRVAEAPSRLRGVLQAAAGVVFLLLNARVSTSTHALRPERAARVTELVDEAIRQVIRTVPEGEVAFIRNDEFPPVARALARGATALRFPGIGAYWALAHGRPVPIEPPPGPSPSGAPAASGAAATSAVPSPGGPTPVRFVVMDDALLKAIASTFSPAIAGYFVSPAFVNARGAAVLTLDAADPETLTTLEKNKRGMMRVNDL